ncbi:EAL domain-containing protein [Vibrio sp. HN007]|uniref:EAL domain-containing protein n=1 Tax=Vibrio iocasae TaxID=3098914 RepID=UPI0035D45C64
MDIVVIDKNKAFSSPVGRLERSNHDILWANNTHDLIALLNGLSCPYMVLANFQSVIMDNAISALLENNSQCLKGVILYGDVDERILLPIRVFCNKLGGCRLHFLGNSLNISKLNRLISNAESSELGITDFKSEVVHDSVNEKIAINYQTITPYFQSIVSGETKRNVGYEVLGRISHNNQTLSPLVFLEQLIQSGAITDYTYTLVYKALESIQQLDNFDGTLSFNIDYQSLDDSNFHKKLCTVFKAFDFPLHRVILELSEHNPIYSGTVIENLTKFRGDGVGISIDDFGMADSGFTQLLNIPFTEIKIDRSYISEMEGSDYMYKIVKALSSVASCMEVNVVAEGVENATQITMLQLIGVNRFQGFYFSRPAPIESIVTKNKYH